MKIYILYKNCLYILIHLLHFYLQNIKITLERDFLKKRCAQHVYLLHYYIEFHSIRTWSEIYVFLIITKHNLATIRFSTSLYTNLNNKNLLLSFTFSSNWKKKLRKIKSIPKNNGVEIKRVLNDSSRRRSRPKDVLFSRQIIRSLYSRQVTKIAAINNTECMQTCSQDTGKS